MKKHPATLQEAIRYFSDEQTCIDTIAKLRWPDGKPTCPVCAHKDHYWLATQKRWKCKNCGRQFSVKRGTIFEDSPLPLDKWLAALWMIVNCKNGISSYEISRDLGITQKSAWFMLHRLRLALQSRSVVKIGGRGQEVEVDETFIGGAARFMHADKRKRRITETGTKDKVAVLGMLERGGDIRTAVVGNRRKHGLQTQIRTHVAAHSATYTDALLSYQGLNHRDFIHKTVDHAESYVDGQVHTNGLENFWSLLKRGLKGTYISVEPFHLFQVFRFNHRKTKFQNVTDADRFRLALSHIAGRRLC